MTTRFRVLAALLVSTALCLAAFPAWAGEGWHLTLAGTENGETRSAELRMDGDYLRAAEEDGAQEVIIDDLGFTVLDHANETYSTITFDQIETMLGAFKSMADNLDEQQKAQLREAMKSMPPEQRKQLEAQLGEEEPDEQNIEIEKTGKTEKIAGLETRHMVVKRDGEPVAEAWVTDQIDTGSIRALMDRFSSMLGQVAGAEAKFMEQFKDLEGFPMRVVDLSEGDPQEVLLVTAAEKTTFSRSDFSPPAGYEKTEMPMGGMGR